MLFCLIQVNDTLVALTQVLAPTECYEVIAAAITVPVIF